MFKEGRNPPRKEASSAVPAESRKSRKNLANWRKSAAQHEKKTPLPPASTQSFGDAKQAALSAASQRAAAYVRTGMATAPPGVIQALPFQYS